MKAALETELERRLRSSAYRTTRDAVESMRAEGLINSPKQAWATLAKWGRRGRYAYGVSLDLGWLLDPDGSVAHKGP